MSLLDAPVIPKDSTGRRLDSVAVAPGNRIVDMVSSWWSMPACVYDPVKEEVHTGGCSRGGILALGTFDLRNNTVRKQGFVSAHETVTADDHFVPAILNVPGQPLQAMSAWHDETKDFSRWSFRGRNDTTIQNAEVVVPIPSADTTSYSQVFSRPDTVPAMIVNIVQAKIAAVDSWWICRSSDRGATWTDFIRFHSARYQAMKRSGDGTGNTLFLALTDHPTTDSVVSIKFLKVPLAGANGPIQDSAGNQMVKADGTGNAARMWGTAATGGNPLIDKSTANTVRTLNVPDSQRLYDISDDGNSVGVARFQTTDLTNGTYQVLKRQTSATTNTWAVEALRTTGKPFGYPQSFYTGGLYFETGGNACLIIVEENDIWRLERWVRTGPAFGTGTWARDRILYTAPAGRKLGRCRIPEGSGSLAAGKRIWVCGEYSYYGPADFTTMVGDQILGRY